MIHTDDELGCRATESPSTDCSPGQILAPAAGQIVDRAIADNRTSTESGTGRLDQAALGCDKRPRHPGLARSSGIARLPAGLRPRFPAGPPRPGGACAPLLR